MRITRLHSSIAGALVLAGLTAAAAHLGVEGVIEAIYSAGYSAGAWLRGG